MTVLKTITAREANHRFAELLREVESEGSGFLVTRRGRPVARIVPAEIGDRLSARQRAALESFLGAAKPLHAGRFDRDLAHERR